MECDGESQGGKLEAMPGTKGDGARGPIFEEISKAWSTTTPWFATPGPDIVGIQSMMGGGFIEKSLIAVVEDRSEFVIFEDGYTYYCPTGGMGVLTAHNLRTIADELDRRNTPIDELYKKEISE